MKIVNAFTGALLAAASLLWAAGPARAQAPDPVFIASTWSDTSVHLLDAGLNSITSFSAGASNPNGIATDGTTIYTGHFSTSEVIAYDFSGTEQFRWSASIGNLQGMDLVGTELAVANAGNIQFHDAATGALVRSIPATVSGSVEGVAFDGTVLWLLGSDIAGVDPQNGNVVSTISNAASGCSFAGTGITASAPGELHLGCTNGDWYRVSSNDGSVLASGNNGLNMYGLKLAAGSPGAGVVEPTEPVPTLGPAGLGLLMLLFAGLAWASLRARFG
jgi:hypothetical protein